MGCRRRYQWQCANLGPSRSLRHCFQRRRCLQGQFRSYSAAKCQAVHKTGCRCIKMGNITIETDIWMSLSIEICVPFVSSPMSDFNAAKRESKCSIRSTSCLAFFINKIRKRFRKPHHANTHEKRFTLSLKQRICCKLAWHHYLCIYFILGLVVFLLSQLVLKPVRVHVS